jgi:hypothetical protein
MTQNRFIPTAEQIAKRQEKRELLKLLSKQVRPLVEGGTFTNINAALVHFYETQGHKNLKSFNAWKRAGYNIKKGMVALSLWGEKRTVSPEQNEQDEYQFFPVAYVFSEIQVEQANRESTLPTRPELSKFSVAKKIEQPAETQVDDLPF